MQVALLAGLLYSAVGFLQLGWIINFLSQSVIAGFMTGASVIIGLQQVKFLMGYACVAVCGAAYADQFVAV